MLVDPRWCTRRAAQAVAVSRLRSSGVLANQGSAFRAGAHRSPGANECGRSGGAGARAGIKCASTGRGNLQCAGPRGTGNQGYARRCAGGQGQRTGAAITAAVGLRDNFNIRVLRRSDGGDTLWETGVTDKES